MICGRPASLKTFKKWFVGGPQASKPLKSDLRGGHIGAQETIETAIGIPLWIFLHQKDKLENKIKQDHFKWLYRATLHDYNRASLNEPRGEHFRWAFPQVDRFFWLSHNFVARFVAQYFQATNKRQIGYKLCKNFDLFSGICFIETPFVILHWLYRFYIWFDTP